MREARPPFSEEARLGPCLFITRYEDIKYHLRVVTGGMVWQINHACLEEARCPVLLSVSSQREEGEDDAARSWLKNLSLELVVQPKSPVRNTFRAFNLGHNMASNTEKNLMGRKRPLPQIKAAF